MCQNCNRLKIPLFNVNRQVSKMYIILIFVFNVTAFTQTARFTMPEKIDSTQNIVFYLHGRIIEEKGPRPLSEKYGIYEYEKILNRFEQEGFVLFSEARKKNTNAIEYAGKIASKIDSLLKAGVPDSNITVIGASKGAAIAILISHYLKNRNLKFVIMAICSDSMANFWQKYNAKLWGRILYIYEKSDDIAGSCKDYLGILKSKGLAEYKEIELKTGLSHGFLYRPIDEWFGPALNWAGRRVEK